MGQREQGTGLRSGHADEAGECGLSDLSAEAFERLLGVLDTDRERAAERYEDIRRRLLRFFRWRGCPAPEQLSDETFDRVARRLAEGVALQAPDPYSYVHGVALRVAHEHWRRTPRETELDEVTARREALARQAEPEDADETGPRLQCLTTCLDRLPPAQRRMFETYHAGQGGARIRARQVLADELGIPINALRIRVFRLRAGLFDCITECAAGSVK